MQLHDEEEYLKKSQHHPIQLRVGEEERQLEHVRFLQP